MNGQHPVRYQQECKWCDHTINQVIKIAADTQEPRRIKCANCERTNYVEKTEKV